MRKVAQRRRFVLRPSGDQLLFGTAKDALQHGADTLGYPGSALYAPSAEGSKVFSQTPDAHAEFRCHPHRNAGSDGFVDRESGIASVAGEDKVYVDGILIIFEKVDHRAARNSHEGLQEPSRGRKFKISDDDLALSIQPIGPDLRVEAQVQSTSSDLCLAHLNEIGLEPHKIHCMKGDLR